MAASPEAWVAAIPAFALSLIVIFIPGLIIGALIRLRGLWLAATAPAISLTAIGLASIALPVLKMPWSVLSVVVFSAIFGTVVVMLFRYILKVSRAPHGEHRSKMWPTLVGWALGAIPLGIVTVLSIGVPENISQTFDNIFHLNTIAEITRSGSASPFTVGLLIAPDGGQSFYPDGWHSAVQLVMQISGAAAPLAINAFNVAIAVSIWPLGIILLTRQLVGASSVAAIAAGIFSAAFPAAPLALLYYGVLYPFFLGVALIPAVLALIINLLALGREERFMQVVAQIVLLAGLLPAIALAHPGALMAVLAFAVPAAIVATFADWKSISRSRRRLRSFGLASFIIIGSLMLFVLRPGVVWGPRLSPLRAAWETVTLSLGGYGLPLLAALFMVLGIVVALTRLNKTTLTMVGMWVMGAALFFITAGVSNRILRGPTGVWYADTPRLASIYPIVVIPLIVLGTVYLTEKIGSRTKSPVIISTLVLMLTAVISLVTAGYSKFTPTMLQSYTATETAALLSPDEARMLEAVPDIVPEDAMIAGNPWTGTSLALALSDREVVLTHVFMKETSTDRNEVMSHLKEATPAACEAADHLGVEFVLDFGDREVHGGHHEFEGIENVEESASFELVERFGAAALYRLTGCD